MKRLVLVLLIACALVLPACSGVGASYASADSFEVGELRNLRNTGFYTDGAEGSVDSYLTQDGAAFLLFNDYEAMQQYPLCAQRDCAHNDDTCDAFVDAEDPIHFVHVAGDKIILERQNEEAFERDSFSLERRDLDGGNRELIVDIQGKLMSYGQYVTDDTALFLQMINGGEETVSSGEFSLKPHEATLVRIDITTGEIAKLRDMAGYLLIGADGGELLLWDDTTDTRGLVAYTPETNTDRELAAPPAEVSALDTTSIYEGMLYYLATDGTATELVGYSPTEGEAALSVKLPAGEYTLDSIVGKHALVYTSDATGEPTVWSYVDLTRAEVIEVPSKINNKGHLTPARIIGFYGDNYLVVSGSVDYSYKQGGSLIDTSRNTYAELSSKDYWSGATSQKEMVLWAPQ